MWLTLSPPLGLLCCLTVLLVSVAHLCSALSMKPLYLLHGVVGILAHVHLVQAACAALQLGLMGKTVGVHEPEAHSRSHLSPPLDTHAGEDITHMSAWRPFASH